VARLGIVNLQTWLAVAQQAGYRSRALAKGLKVSQRQLQRYTQAAFGRSPQRWLDEWRLRAASNMLKKSRSVKAVAFSLGFKQVSHFSREFKRHYGQPPSTFVRWNHQGVTANASQSEMYFPELAGNAVRYIGCPPQITNVRVG